MKFKCGKCKQVSEAAVENIMGATEQFITVKCIHCSTLNKLPRTIASLPVVAKLEDYAPTEILNKNIIRPAVSEKRATVDIIPGWVFVHDENTARQSFDLKIGKNIIGRKSSVNVDVPIETGDEYMSRKHCIVEVRPRPDNSFEFLLCDYKALNGTFINGLVKKRLMTGDIILLNDGDTIQLGMTKVVIRINNHAVNKNQAEVEVNRSSYAPTVLVGKR